MTFVIWYFRYVLWFVIVLLCYYYTCVFSKFHFTTSWHTGIQKLYITLCARHSSLPYMIVFACLHLSNLEVSSDMCFDVLEKCHFTMCVGGHVHSITVHRRTPDQFQSFPSHAQESLHICLRIIYAQGIFKEQSRKQKLSTRKRLNHTVSILQGDFMALKLVN